jgi:hypothetical protein
VPLFTTVIERAEIIRFNLVFFQKAQRILMHQSTEVKPDFPRHITDIPQIQAAMAARGSC